MNGEAKQNQDFKCSRWLQFLDESIGSQPAIDSLQEFFGYCLTTKNSPATALLVYGPGGTGKSVAMNILGAVVGPENISNLSVGDLADPDRRAALFGKAVNFAHEGGLKALGDQYFKAIVSGDTITVSDHAGSLLLYQPTCKLVVHTNRFPKEILLSKAIYGRVLPVAFMGQPSRPYPRLFEKLAVELPSIRMWAHAGLVRLRAQGRFTNPSGWE